VIGVDGHTSRWSRFALSDVTQVRLSCGGLEAGRKSGYLVGPDSCCARACAQTFDTAAARLLPG
jgi:hypothetical protein